MLLGMRVATHPARPPRRSIQGGERRAGGGQFVHVRIAWRLEVAARTR